MPKKKGPSIGKDVLGKVKKAAPSKAELTIKSPFDLFRLRLEWERKEGRQLSEEEFKSRLKQYKKRIQERRQRQKSKLQRKVKPYV